MIVFSGYFSLVLWLIIIVVGYIHYLLFFTLGIR